jgi:hypothetical protein
MKNFKIDVSSRKSWEFILLSTFEQKTAFLVISKPKNAGNHPFFPSFLFISGGMGAYLTPLTPFTTIPCPAIPPINNWCTKQFLSRPYGL